MIPISTNKEGKVNVALGARAESLATQANKIGTTKTNLARILLVDALRRLESGEATIKGPSIEPVEKEVAP